MTNPQEQPRPTSSDSQKKSDQDRPDQGRRSEHKRSQSTTPESEHKDEKKSPSAHPAQDTTLR